jgi:hypothetical protein
MAQPAKRPVGLATVSTLLWRRLGARNEPWTTTVLTVAAAAPLRTFAQWLTLRNTRWAMTHRVSEQELEV